MFLDATTKSIELVLGAAATTNAMPVVVDYVDLTTTTTLAGVQDSASNGVTAVTILSSPAASTQRKVNGITVYNADTAAKAVTVRLNNNATLRPLVVATLQVGDTLGYTDTQGWYVQDTSGNRKVTTGSGGGSGTVTSVSVVSANGLAGTVATATTTPAITLSTSITGVLKGNGTAISAAAAATDYVAPSAYASANGLTISAARLLGRTTAGTGSAEEITVGAGLSLSAGTLTATGGASSSVAADLYNNQFLGGF